MSSDATPAPPQQAGRSASSQQHQNGDLVAAGGGGDDADGEADVDDVVAASGQEGAYGRGVSESDQDALFEHDLDSVPEGLRMLSKHQGKQVSEAQRSHSRIAGSVTERACFETVGCYRTGTSCCSRPGTTARGDIRSCCRTRCWRRRSISALAFCAVHPAAAFWQRRCGCFDW